MRCIAASESIERPQRVWEASESIEASEASESIERLQSVWRGSREYGEFSECMEKKMTWIEEDS